MTIQAPNTRSLIAFICAGVLIAAGAAPHLLRQANASAPAVSPKVDQRLVGATGDVRIYIGVASNNLGRDLVKHHAAQLARQERATSRARDIAAANPYLLTEQERSAAQSVESLRNQALAAIRKAARPDVIASKRVAALIARGGGEVHQSAPLPNSITATVPAELIDILAQSSLVSSITPAGAKPFLMNSPVDGSETWHTNGFTGQYNGAAQTDGTGGPDFGAIDAGVRTTHLAFRTRLSGDPNNGPATGPTRITSPPGRVNFSGSEHGNTVAATVANTDLSVVGWTYAKGLAYGVDKVYDPNSIQSGFYWLTGITYDVPGVTDLPEANNYSAGIYENTTDFNSAWIFIDDHVASFGITYSISGGNCGLENGGFTGCNMVGLGPHRVSTPGNLHNTITVGGLDYNGDAYNSNVWIPWANSSPGPTWGGRKKPDLIHKTTPSGAGPNDQNDTTYENTGEGTSYAAPVASAGALLLASAGVYQPTAQKAILVNTATPIQSQTYWTPKSGWGALDLDAAFYQRANYASSSITGSAENGVRFFRATGVTSGDRSTLVWNRRTATSTTYHPLTNLDLSQHNQATGATTATGGSDAADTVDTNLVVSAANPMPGSGTDGGDNVEQVRSTSSGTQVLKVKALSAVTGLTAEPFSIASKNALTTLETPVPSVDLVVAPSTTGVGDSATVTATVTNASSDIALTGAAVTLTVPGDVSITSGTATQAFGALAVDATAVGSWQVQGSASGIKSLLANSTATAYSETFTGQDTADLTVDSEPPVVSVNGPGQWSAEANAPFTWSAIDPSGIASYDVSTSINDAAPQLILDGTATTSGAFTAPEGAKLTVLVSAEDNAGNASTQVSASTTIDAFAPVISLAPTEVVSGRATVRISASNVGSPIVLRGVFGTDASAPLVGLSGTSMTFLNPSASAKRADARGSATDALRRVATAAVSINVPSLIKAAGLRLARPKASKQSVTISGSINKSARGRVTITITRVGKTGSKHKDLGAPIRSGKYAAKTKLAKGRYKIRASYPGSSSVTRSTASKTFTVK